MTIRVGDHIRIVNPRWIKRIGYPLHWKDLQAEVESDPRVSKFLADIGYSNRGYIPVYFTQSVAKLLVESRGFGGRDRTIHYMPFQTPGDSFLDALETVPAHGYVGRTCEVLKKRTAYTGRYFPPHGGGEDWESGGLDDRKAHVILATHFGEIEACDVEKVSA